MSAVLAFVLVLSLAACGAKPTESTEPTDSVPSTETVEESTTNATVENPVTFFSLSYGENFQDIKSMTAITNEDGSIYIEHIDAEKKVGEMDASVMHGITAAFEKTELLSLNGADVYGEGEANASMYIEFADGTSATVNYTGEIPEAFTNGYAAMNDYFKTLTASLEVYVPQPMVVGEVNENMLNAANEILYGSNMPNLDALTINHIATDDEFFGETAGLTNNEGVANAVSIAPMMMSQAYSLVIVELAEDADAAAIGTDFEENIDWRKWVCVAPSNALIATKDNMVLCLQAADDAYAMTVAGIEASGWVTIKELTNPDM